MKLSCIKPMSKVRGLSIEPCSRQFALINACIIESVDSISRDERDFH